MSSRRTPPRQSDLPTLWVTQLRALLACPRRFAARFAPTHERATRSMARSPGAYRCRDAVAAAVRDAHVRSSEHGQPWHSAVCRAPPAALGLEEREVFARAIDTYDELYGDECRPVLHPPVGGWKAPAPSNRYLLGAFGDVVLGPTPDGVVEIRRPMWPVGANDGAEIPLPGSAEPSESSLEEVGLAAVVRARLLNRPDICVVSVPLLGDGRVRRVVPSTDELAAFRHRLERAVDAAIDGPPAALPGTACRSCPEISGCPALAPSGVRTVHPLSQCSPASVAAAGHHADHVAALAGSGPLPTGRGAAVRSSPPPPTSRRSFADEDLGAAVPTAPGVLVLSPSSVRDWLRCPRQYFLSHVVQLPRDRSGVFDVAGSSSGIAVHERLRKNHDVNPACRPVPDAFVAGGSDAGESGVAEPDDANATTCAAIAAHGSLCPSAHAEYLGGEVELRVLIARRNLLVSGRVDALWRYDDGTIEARDYKTGSCPESLDGDLVAAIYALLVARGVRDSGPRRLVYERLGATVPSLASLEVTDGLVDDTVARLVGIADDIRAAGSFVARPSERVCRACEYGAICSRSAWKGAE